VAVQGDSHGCEAEREVVVQVTLMGVRQKGMRLVLGVQWFMMTLWGVKRDRCRLGMGEWWYKRGCG
jgi:hypothetical protein